MEMPKTVGLSRDVLWDTNLYKKYGQEIIPNLPKELSIDSILTRSGLNHTFESIDLEYYIPELKRTLAGPARKIIYSKELGLVTDITSNKYHIVQTADALSYIDVLMHQYEHIPTAIWDADQKATIGVILVTPNTFSLGDIRYQQIISCVTSHTRGTSTKFNIKYLMDLGLENTWAIASDYLAEDLSMANLIGRTTNKKSEYRDIFMAEDTILFLEQHCQKYYTQVRHTTGVPMIPEEQSKVLRHLVSVLPKFGTRSYDKELDELIAMLRIADKFILDDFCETAYSLEFMAMLYYSFYKRFKTEESKFNAWTNGYVDKLLTGIRNAALN